MRGFPLSEQDRKVIQQHKPTFHMKHYTPRQIVAGIARRCKIHSRNIKQKIKNLIFGPPDRFLDKCKGVIHVGAHDGSEFANYERKSISKVVWIEALPQHFDVLQKTLHGHRTQSAICALITDKDGDYREFHVSNNGGVSSSIYDFKDHKKVWPTVAFSEIVRLCSKTLATALREAGHRPSEFDALVMDVQGAEELVIKGAEDFLDSIRYIKAEAADFELYSGACTLETLTATLRERGFVLRRTDCFESKRGVGSCYDAVYERMSS